MHGNKLVKTSTLQVLKTSTLQVIVGPIVGQLMLQHVGSTVMPTLLRFKYSEGGTKRKVHCA